jgi:glycosyltransferase involved in cell wall biosynthesis
MGLDTLIHAFRVVVMNAPDIYLVIGGEGALKDRLKKLAQELGVGKSVKFTGFIPEEDLPDYYHAADLFVVPSLDLEGFGLVILEAMASGVPVLGTPVGGAKEILGKFNPEFLFKAATPESMARLILATYQKIKQDPEGWAVVSNRCRDFVVRNYSWEKNLDSLERVYDQG